MAQHLLERLVALCHRICRVRLEDAVVGILPLQAGTRPPDARRHAYPALALPASMKHTSMHGAERMCKPEFFQEDPWAAPHLLAGVRQTEDDVRGGSAPLRR